MREVPQPTLDEKPTLKSGTRIDRYELHSEIASGGMATVHLARLVGRAGFGRTVAIKRLHPHLAKEAEFVAMLTDEARIAGRIGHPNIVPTLDVIVSQYEVFLVMEYVAGLTIAAMAKLIASDVRDRPPLPVICSIMAGVLHGLHAAHEARDEHGIPLEVVHRDVSPQNILVGVDGVARVLDFGIAKAAGRLHTTRDGQVKGKVGYMSPEQLCGRSVDRRTDIYAASVVLWEFLTGQRLFDGDDGAMVFGAVMQKRVAPPSQVASGLSAVLDEITLRGLDREPSRRFPRARDMALAIEAVVPLATPSEVGSYVSEIGGDFLGERARAVTQMEEAGSKTATHIIASTGEITEVTSTLAPSPTRVRPRTIGLSLSGAAAALGLFAAGMHWGATPRGEAAPSALSSQAGLGAGPARGRISESSPGEALVPPAASSSEARPGAGGPPGEVSSAGRAASPRSRPPSYHVRPPVHPAPAKAPATPNECIPPYTIDSQGHKHYKLSCI